MAKIAEILTDSKGNEIGTKKYFTDLNEQCYMKGLLQNTSDYNYYLDISRKDPVIKKVISIIYHNPFNNKSLIHQFPKKNINSLKNMILGFKGYLNITGDSSSSADKCIAMLDLSDHNTGYKSRASQKDIDEGVNKLYR